jgi:hypothetical protein
VFDCLPELLCSEPFDHAHRSLTARAEPPDGCGRGRCWNRQRFDRQQRAAKRKQRTAPAIGEKAEVANAREPSGEDMLQEPPQELLVSQRHGAALAVVRIILPAEGNAGIVATRHLPSSDKIAAGRGRQPAAAPWSLRRILEPAGKAGCSIPNDVVVALTHLPVKDVFHRVPGKPFQALCSPGIFWSRERHQPKKQKKTFHSRMVTPRGSGGDTGHPGAPHFGHAGREDQIHFAEAKDHQSRWRGNQDQNNRRLTNREAIHL